MSRLVIEVLTDVRKLAKKDVTRFDKIADVELKREGLIKRDPKVTDGRGRMYHGVSYGKRDGVGQFFQLLEGAENDEFSFGII